MGSSAPLADQAKPAGALGDEHVAVRQPRHAPRVRQLARDDRDANLVLFGRVEDDGPGGQRHLGDADGEPAAPPALLRGAGGR